MLSKVNLDELSRDAREFYERALMKFSASLFFASLAFFFLGLAAQSGGLSAGYSHFQDTANNPSDAYDEYGALVSGYGFACFGYVCAFIIASTVSLFISPLVSTKREGLMLRSPADFDTSASPSFSEPQPNPSLYDGYPKTS